MAMRIIENGIARDATIEEEKSMAEVAKEEEARAEAEAEKPTIDDLVEAINILSNIVIGE